MSLRDWLLGHIEPEVRDSVEDWKAGDVAVCSQKGSWCFRDHTPAHGPAFGEMAKVVEVHLFSGAQFLALVGYNGAYMAACFTKLRGDKAEACGADFARQIKRQWVKEPELV